MDNLTNLKKYLYTIVRKEHLYTPNEIYNDRVLEFVLNERCNLKKEHKSFIKKNIDCGLIVSMLKREQYLCSYDNEFKNEFNSYWEERVVNRISKMSINELINLSKLVM